MWGTSLPEDKLAGDLGNVIEATSNRQSSVGFFYSRQIGAEQFRTFSTASTLNRHQCDNANHGGGYQSY
jgi:hypothetical protein